MEGDLGIEEDSAEQLGAGRVRLRATYRSGKGRVVVRVSEGKAEVSLGIELGVRASAPGGRRRGHVGRRWRAP